MEFDSLNLKVFYLNCKLKRVADTEYRLIAALARDFGENVPITGLPTDEIYRMFIQKVDQKSMNLILVLDEIDSGLDIDAIKLVADLISSIANENNAIMLVTHYSRILKYLEISKVHIIVDGKIVMSGDSDLIEQIDSEGYSQFQES